MWKVCLLLSLVGTLQHPVAAGFPNIPWPPSLPADMFLPFLPQIVVPVQSNKIALVLLDVHVRGLAMNNSCNFGKAIFTAFQCTNITLRAGFKAGGGIFDLPVVGRGTISLDLALDVNLVNFYALQKMPVVFTTFKFEIDGLNPGSDMTYLVNGLVNNLTEDFEQAIKILGKKLLVTDAAECGAGNVERLGEALLAEEAFEKYLKDLNVENEHSETEGKPLETEHSGTEGKPLETEKTKSSKTEASLDLETTLRCDEAVIAAKLKGLGRLSPDDQFLWLSETLGEGLAALFTLYTPN